MATLNYNKIDMIKALREYGRGNGVSTDSTRYQYDQSPYLGLKNAKEMVELVLNMVTAVDSPVEPPKPVELTDDMVTNYLREKLYKARDEARRYQSALDGILDELPF